MFPAIRRIARKISPLAILSKAQGAPVWAKTDTGGRVDENKLKTFKPAKHPAGAKAKPVRELTLLYIC